MENYDFTFGSAQLVARASGTLWWPDQSVFCVSDLHLGKAQNLTQNHRGILPPYENSDTLSRLQKEISCLNPETIICLGDSFDCIGAEDRLDMASKNLLANLQKGRNWYWIEGNHDPQPIALSGQFTHQLKIEDLTFRHFAEPDCQYEISGHFHPKYSPKTRSTGPARKCFLIDRKRIILPAFGTYTGGLKHNSYPLNQLMGPGTVAVTTGPRALPFPVPATETGFSGP